jgi:hypothetical protein
MTIQEGMKLLEDLRLFENSVLDLVVEAIPSGAVRDAESAIALSQQITAKLGDFREAFVRVLVPPAIQGKTADTVIEDDLDTDPVELARAAREAFYPGPKMRAHLEATRPDGPRVRLTGIPESAEPTISELEIE